MLAGHLRAEVFRHQVSGVGIGANFYHTQLSLGNGLLYPKTLDFDLYCFSESLPVHHPDGCGSICADYATHLDAEVCQASIAIIRIARLL